MDRADTDRSVSAAPGPSFDDRSRKPRIGWGSIAILAVVAAAACTAGWWIDRGPIDPGAAEIKRARIAERAETSRGRVKTTMKTKTATR